MADLICIIPSMLSLPRSNKLTD